MNPPKLTILAADTDAACDPETGTCTIPQTPIPSPARRRQPARSFRAWRRLQAPDLASPAPGQEPHVGSSHSCCPMTWISARWDGSQLAGPC